MPYIIRYAVQDGDRSRRPLPPNACNPETVLSKYYGFRPLVVKGYHPVFSCLTVVRLN